MLVRGAVAEPKVSEAVVAVAAEPESIAALHAYLGATSAPLSRTLRSKLLLLGPAARNAADRARRAADLVLAEALQQQSMVAHMFERQHLLCERASGSATHSDSSRLVASRLWHAAGCDAVQSCTAAQMYDTHTAVHVASSATPVPLFRREHSGRLRVASMSGSYLMKLRTHSQWS